MPSGSIGHGPPPWGMKTVGINEEVVVWPMVVDLVAAPTQMAVAAVLVAPTSTVLRLNRVGIATSVAQPRGV